MYSSPSALNTTKHLCERDFLDGSGAKNLPVMQKIWIQSLGWDDSLEDGMATHSSILAWRIPWTEEPDGLQFIECRVGHD